nr:nitrilase like 1 [Quercus suber]
MQMEQNFAKAADFIRAAALQKAQLAVLPEYHLLNWLPHDEKFKEACSHWETYLTKYRNLAKECNINVVPGTLVELHDAGSDEERLLNVAYFITNTGEIAGKYVKKNLWGPIERLHLTSSSMDEHPVFDTPLGKVGMLICWDLAFPEAFREMISKGAKLIPSSSPTPAALQVKVTLGSPKFACPTLHGELEAIQIRLRKVIGCNQKCLDECHDSACDVLPVCWTSIRISTAFWAKYPIVKMADMKQQLRLCLETQSRQVMIRSK